MKLILPGQLKPWHKMPQRLYHVGMALILVCTSSFSNLLYLQTSASAVVESSGNLKVATYNIRATDPDRDATPNDKWTDKRSNAILNYMLSVDIMGAQEGRDDSMKWLRNKAKSNGYGYSTVSIARGVFWKSSLFSLIDEKKVDTAKDSDGNVKDMVWVKLQSTTSGAALYVVSIHLSVTNNTDRERQARSAMGYISANLTDAPVIFMGDMNAETNTGPDKIIRDAGFSDTSATAATKSNFEYASTLSGVWGKPYKTKTGPVDHIYTKGAIATLSVTVRIDTAGSDHLPVEAELSLGGAGTPVSVGTYNILGWYHGEDGKFGDKRLAQIAKNISEVMQYDVVGLQEYRTPDKGEKNALEKAVQAVNASYKVAYSDDVNGEAKFKDYNSQQLPIVYNSSTVTLIDHWDVEANITAVGGTPATHIARFTVTATGQEFIVLNVHLTSEGGNLAEKRVTTLKKGLEDTQVAGSANPVFIVGDMNANPNEKGDENTAPENYLTSIGYENAYDTAASKVGEAPTIDHVYYKTSTISAPTSYERLVCNPITKKSSSGADPSGYVDGKTTCASDHRPSMATFGAGSGNCGELTEAQLQQFDAWTINLYDPRCTCSESTGTGVMSGDTNFKKIASYLASKGLNAIAIAGILGNWDVESPGLSVFRHEDGQGWTVGGYGLAQWTGSRRTNGSGTGVADALKKDTRTKEYFAQYYTSGYGAPPGEGGIPEGIPTDVNDAWLQVELDFMLEEFTQAQYDIGGGYTKLLKTAVTVHDGDDMKTALNAAKSATDAALIFTTIFEKQGALAAIKDGTKEQLLSAVEKRLTQAEKDLSDVQSLVGSGSGTAASGGSCAGEAATGAVIVDGMTFPLQGVNKDYIGDGGGGKGSHLGDGTCPNYWAYDLMMAGSDEAKSAAKTVKVVAITEGTISNKVTIKSYSLSGQAYGWQLGLESSDGTLYYYTHMLSEPIAKKGQAVKVGDLLETGVKDVNGEHLHIDASPKGKGRNGPFATGISRSSCSSASEGDFIELGPALKKLWEAIE